MQRLDGALQRVDACTGRGRDVVSDHDQPAAVAVLYYGCGPFLRFHSIMIALFAQSALPVRRDHEDEVPAGRRSALADLLVYHSRAGRNPCVARARVPLDWENRRSWVSVNVFARV